MPDYTSEQLADQKRVCECSHLKNTHEKGVARCCFGPLQRAYGFNDPDCPCQKFVEKKGKERIDNTSGYSEAEGKKIDAFTAKAHHFFTTAGKDLEPGMLCDAILIAAASSIGGGFRDRAAFNRNVNRLTESFRRVLTHQFEKTEARRRAT